MTSMRRVQRLGMGSGEVTREHPLSFSTWEILPMAPSSRAKSNSRGMVLWISPATWATKEERGEGKDRGGGVREGNRHRYWIDKKLRVRVY